MCLSEPATSDVPLGTLHDDEAVRTRLPVWSSGVPFYPPSERLWRIGGKWYDFAPFMQHHPGGAEVLRLAPDRFEDAPYVFEAHHHNYARARRIIAKYQVPAPAVLLKRPAAAACGAPCGAGLDRAPQLCDDASFYSVVRRRLADHLRVVGYPSGGPTRECRVLFWCNFLGF